MHKDEYNPTACAGPADTHGGQVTDRATGACEEVDGAAEATAPRAAVCECASALVSITRYY